MLPPLPHSPLPTSSYPESESNVECGASEWRATADPTVSLKQARTLRVSGLPTHGHGCMDGHGWQHNRALLAGASNAIAEPNRDFLPGD